MALVRKAVVIVAHPRSGTHITLDFIRRNFPAFDPRLRLWDSARELYVSLDRPRWCDDLRRQMRRSDHVLLQSHMAGMRSSTERQAVAFMKPDEAIFIYPFRHYSATMRSFAAFCHYPGRVESFLDESSRFFRNEETVEACARRHGESWLQRDAVFVNVEALMADPHRAAARLGEALGVEPTQLARRLPRRRLFHGKLAEAVERFTGRESTEVQILFPKDWADASEPDHINARFADLHAEMAARSIV
jgi:hypothetical protein